MRIHDLPMPIGGALAQPDPRQLLAWYRPWHYTHSSWLDAGFALPGMPAGTGELERRLGYRMWCARFALALHPDTCDGAIWWELPCLEQAVFERASCLAGLVLMFACDRGLSLRPVRSDAVRSGDVRWSLERASLIGGPPSAPDHWRGLSGAHEYALRSLQLATGHAPALYRRIRLRYPRGRACATLDDGQANPDKRMQRVITRLWNAALRRAGAGLARTETLPNEMEY